MTNEEKVSEKKKEFQKNEKGEKASATAKKEHASSTAKKSAFEKLKGLVKKKEIKPVQLAATDIEPFKILKFVLMTEKAVSLIELQNKLIFIVDKKAEKKEIRAAAESAFQTPVSHVNTIIDQKGRKKAIIKFSQEGQAGEIAIRLGII